MTSKSSVVEERGEPGKKHSLSIQSQVTGNFPACSGRDSNMGSGKRQLAVSGNALDQTAIRAGPSSERQRAVSGNALDHTAIRAGPQVIARPEKALISDWHFLKFLKYKIISLFHCIK